MFDGFKQFARCVSQLYTKTGSQLEESDGNVIQTILRVNTILIPPREHYINKHKLYTSDILKSCFNITGHLVQ